MKFKNKFVLLTMVSMLFLINCSKLPNKSFYTQKNVKKLYFSTKHAENQYSKLSDSADVIEYYLIDGRIDFKSEQDFNNFLIAIEDDEISDWITEVGFSSYFNSNQTGSALLDDDRVAATLNNYGIIQIGDYIIKMIPSTGKVLVMSIDDISSLSSLESATAGSTIIQEFSFDDEVFGILEEQGGVNPGGTIAERSSCKDRFASSDYDPSTYNYNCLRTCSSSTSTLDAMQFKTMVRYQKIGISVRLYSSFSNFNQTYTSEKYADAGFPSSGPTNYYTIAKQAKFEITYSYTPRCRSEVSGTTTVIYFDKSNYANYTYRSTRDCAHYHLKTCFSLNDHCNNVHTSVTTNEISD